MDIYIVLHNRQICLSPLVIFSNFEAISLIKNDYFLNTCVNNSFCELFDVYMCFPFFFN